MADDSPAPLGPKLDKDFLKRRSAHGLAATVVGQACRFALKFGSTIALARLLSPAEFGIFAMVAPILLFVTTLNDLGFAQAIIQRGEISKEQVSGLFWINLAVSLLLAVLLVAVAPAVGWIYREPRVAPLLAATAVVVVLNTLAMTPTALMARDMRFVAQAAVDVGCLALNVAVMIVGAALGLSYWSLVLGQIAASAANLVLVLILTGWRPQRPVRDAKVAGMVRFGANLTGVNLAGYLSMTADNMIIGATAGKVALGLYDRSYNLVVQPLNQLMAPLSRVAIPLLSRLREDPELYRRSFLGMLRMALTLTTPVMITCVVLAPQLIDFLLGEQWRPAAPIFAWICLGGVVAPLFSTAGWVYTTLGRTDRQLRAALAAALISVASFAIGARWGAVGVAAASATAFILLQTPIMLAGCTRDEPLRVRHLATALWPQAVAGACAAGWLVLIRPHADGWFSLGGMASAILLHGLLIAVLPGGREMIRTAANLRRSIGK